jgi:hypothetical protein
MEGGGRVGTAKRANAFFSLRGASAAWARRPPDHGRDDSFARAFAHPTIEAERIDCNEQNNGGGMHGRIS